MKATKNISYFDARNVVKMLHATLTPNTSYASAVRARPVMCTIATQTDSEPVAPVTTSATTSKPPVKATSPTDTNENASYSQATATSQSVKPKQKSDKSLKLNFTKLTSKSSPHVLPVAAPTRERRDSSSSGGSGNLIIDEQMEVAHSKNRERSPGNRSPGGGRQKKRAKHTGTTRKS